MPGLGQEVVVAFTDGDIDRPVITGAVYNGIGPAQANGSADAQGNQVAAGRAGASANAPAWFPGTQAQGALQGHQHGAVFTGIKSQELAASAQGSGGHNQWVFDDSSGANRIELSSTTAATRLQLGHLLMQRDNQRLQPRGHGFDLVSAAHGALRGGSGLLLSAHGRQSSTSSGQQMDSREVQRSLRSAQELAQALAESAQRHQAAQAGEPEPKALPPAQAQAELLASLASTQGTGEQAIEGDEGHIGGGRGTVAAFARPDIAIAAPAGVAAITPVGLAASAGRTVSWVAGQDLTVTAQRHHGSAVRDGIVWFTYGKAQNPAKPNAETGIRLHAATGSVSVQAASAKSLWVADRAVEIVSTNDAVTAGSPQQVLLAAGGSSVRITNGGITLATSGPARFMAAIKELTGGEQAPFIAPALPRAANLPENTLEVTHLYHDDAAVQGAAFEAELADGSRRNGASNAAGKVVLSGLPPGTVRLRFQPDARPYAVKAPVDNAEHKPEMEEGDWIALATKHEEAP